MHLPCQHFKICCKFFGKPQITPNNANTKDQISHAKNNGVKDVQLTPHYSCTYNTN